jgi:preprotein translocase subunit YajC
LPFKAAPTHPSASSLGSVAAEARHTINRFVSTRRGRVSSRNFHVFISEAFAQTAPAAAAGNGSLLGSLSSMLPLVLMFVVLYFVMIRPQMKRQKEHKAMIDALAKGDEVVVGGGVIGRVAKISDSIVHVEVSAGVEIQVQRSAVVQVLPKGSYK